MGVVYRTKDTRLRRQVALKVLLPELVANEERRLRFLRESGEIGRFIVAPIWHHESSRSG